MAKPISRTNRKGQTYHLCEVATRKGEPRLVMSRKPRGKKLTAIPDGYEIAESVNGLVSVRRVGSSPIADTEVALLQRALSRDARLRRYRAEPRGKWLVVHEPATDMSALADLLPWSPSGRLAEIEQSGRFIPVLRFGLADASTRKFIVERWCFRGSVDGWLPLGQTARLAALLEEFLPHLGRESFYDLI